MKLSTTARVTAAALVVGAALAGTTQAKFEDSAASHYTPRALKALGMQWEAKANFYGKQSLSKQKKAAPAKTPISTMPPEGCNAHEVACGPAQQAPAAPAKAECYFGPGECPAENAKPGAGAGTTTLPGPAQVDPCAWNEEEGKLGC